jgi:hypothetical protein
MALSSRNLINTNGYHPCKVPVLQTVFHQISDRFAYRVPMKPEDPTHLPPGYQLRPCCQHNAQKNRKRALPPRPWDLFYLHPTPSALYPPRSIDQFHRDAPQRNVFPSPLSQRVIPTGFPMAARTEQFVPVIRAKVDCQLPFLILHALYTMSFESQGLQYYAFYEHEPYLPSFQDPHPKGTTGFGSCSQPKSTYL